MGCVQLAELTFVGTTEAEIEEVAEWADKLINEIVNLLAPDNRPFGVEERSEQEQIDNYLQVRGNSIAWLQWMANKEFEIMQLLATQLPPEALQALNTRQLALNYALDWSIRMEKIIRG